MCNTQATLLTLKRERAKFPRKNPELESSGNMHMHLLIMSLLPKKFQEIIFCGIGEVALTNCISTE